MVKRLDDIATQLMRIGARVGMRLYDRGDITGAFLMHGRVEKLRKEREEFCAARARLERSCEYARRRIGRIRKEPARKSARTLQLPHGEGNSAIRHLQNVAGVNERPLDRRPQFHDCDG